MGFLFTQIGEGIMTQNEMERKLCKCYKDLSAPHVHNILENWIRMHGLHAAEQMVIRGYRL